MVDGKAKFLMPEQIAALGGQAQQTTAPGQPAEQSTAPSAPTKLLPEDPEELDKVIGPYRPMVRPILTMFSRLAKWQECEPLDKEERDGGEIAFSSLFYQMGGRLDARVLVLLWLIAVTVPRVLEWLDKRETKKLTMRPQLPSVLEVNRERTQLQQNSERVAMQVIASDNG